MKKNLSWKKEENGNKMSISFMDGYYVCFSDNQFGPDYHCFVNSKDFVYILSELANVLNCYNLTFGKTFNEDKEFMTFIETFFSAKYGEDYRKYIKNKDFVNDLVDTFKRKGFIPS